MTTVIKQRDNGSIHTMYKIRQTSHYNAETKEIHLVCQVIDCDTGKVIAVKETNY